MTTRPIVRVSKGHFTPEQYDEVRRLNAESANPLVPALKRLRGLLYYHVGIDPVTNTMVNVSIWTDLDAAKQMDTLPEMLAERQIMEQASVQFDRIANYEPLWTIQTPELASVFNAANPTQE